MKTKQQQPGNFFARLGKWLSQHKTVARLAGFAILLLIPSFTLAQTLDAILSTPQVQEVYHQMVTALVAVIGFLHQLLNYILLLNGALLKNELLYDAGMEETMYVIWTNIRNIVNILFVVVLLGIALYNIVGGKAQDYQLKEILPKFVLALIAVNFSFLGVKVAVDSVSIVTNAMFALPGAVQRDLQQTVSFQRKICEFYYGETDEEYEEGLSLADANPDSATTQALCTPSKTFSDKGKEYFSTFGSHNAAIVLAINMANINDIDKVQLGQNLKLDRLFVNTLMTVFLYIIYGAAFVALTIILIVRLITLWVTIVLSPLIVLRYVLPENIKSAIGSGDDLSKQFVQNAIAPIPIALMMSIGFIMLDSLKQAQYTNTTLATEALGTSLLTSGLNSLQDMIVAFGMVGIIWGGVFAAAKGTSAESIVEGIKGSMESAGKFLLKAPLKYAPLFPMTGIQDSEGKPMKASLGSALEALGRFPQALDEKQAQDTSELLKAITGQDILKNTKEIQKASTPKDALQAFVNASDTRKKTKEFQQDIFKKFDDNKSWKNHPDFDWKFKFRDSTGPISQEKFLQQLKEGKADPEVVKEWIEASRRKHPGMVPQVPSSTPGPQPTTPQGAPSTPTASPSAVDANAAKGILENSGFNSQKQALTAGQQKELDKLRQDLAKAKNDQEVQAILAKQQANLQEIQELRKASQDFNKDIGDIYTKQGSIDEKKQKANDRIQQYRQDLIAKIKQKEPNISDADLEKRVNKALYRDVAALPSDLKQANEAQKVLTSISDSEAKELKATPAKVVIGAGGSGAGARASGSTGTGATGTAGAKPASGSSAGAGAGGASAGGSTGGSSSAGGSSGGTAGGGGGTP